MAATDSLKNITNPLGQKTLCTPDALDRITPLTESINGNTGKEMGALLDVAAPLTVTDSLSHTTTFTYDLGDLIKVKDPLNRETQRILDAAGRCVTSQTPLGRRPSIRPTPWTASRS
jgi:hypothetical protein